MHHLKASQFV